ncbi:MAG: serine kinase [Chloroflexi bacterium]|nr:serine kinase [Chloroflexota bacterium]
MNVADVVSSLGLEVLCGADGLDREVTGGYASDLLSCVMAGAAAGQVWVTLQAHPNVVAVADLLGLACVIIAENVRPDEATVARANERGIPILSSAETTFTVVAGLVGQGVSGASPKHAR